MPRPNRFRRAALLGALVLLPAGAWVAGSHVRTDRQAAADADPPEPAVLTEPVERRALTKTIVFRATTAASQLTPVKATGSLPGAAVVITATPLAIGAEVPEGGNVLEVAGRPVIALHGAFGSYRDVGVGDSGPDVAQLEAAVARLGADPGRTDGVFDERLATAVSRVWRDAGYVAQTRAEPDPPVAPAAEGGGAPAAPAARQLPYVPAGEVVFLATFPAYVARLDVAVGAEPTEPPMAVAAGPVTITGQMSAADAASVTAGAVVTLTDEQAASTFTGTIAEVGALQTDPDGRQSVSVRIAPDIPLAPSSGGRELRVTVDLATTDDEVLVVPLTALGSRADAITEVDVVEPDGRVRPVAVTAGLTADGYVQVTPEDGGLDEGDRVRVG